MSAKKVATPTQRVELSRHLAMPVLLLALMTIPWFTGGRDPFGLFLISLLSVLLYISWFIVSRHRALRVSLQPHWVMIPVTGLLSASILSLIWSVSRFDTLGQLIVLIAAALCLFVARDVFSEDPLAEKFFRTLWVLMASIITIIGFGLFVAGDYDRLTSLFYWPNPMATFLIPAILVAWQSAAEVKREVKSNAKNYWTWQIGAGLAVAGLVLTYSRAAWLIALAIVSIWVFVSPDWQRRLRTALTSVLIAIPLVAGLVTARGVYFKKPSINVQTRVVEVGQSNSVKDRLAYWRESTAMFSVRPVLGWGTGTFKEVHPSYQETPATAGSNPHNSFLQAMVELGLLGFVTYGGLIVGWLMLGWQLFNTKDRTGWHMTGWLIVSSMGLHSLVDLMTNYPVLILSGAIWLATALPDPENKKWFEFRLKSWLYGSIWFVLGLVLLGLSWVSYRMYLTNLDKQYIDAVAPFDWPDAQDRYTTLYKSNILDPDYLSYGVIQAVDHFESTPGASPSQLDIWESAARRATEAEPMDAKHWYALGVVSERQGKVTEALNYYRKAIDLDPYDNPQYQISYAVLLRREGFSADAIKALRSVTAAYTPSVLKDRGISNLPQRLSSAHVLLADIFHDQGDNEGVESELAQAENLSPKSTLVKSRRETWFK